MNGDTYSSSREQENLVARESTTATKGANVEVNVEKEEKEEREERGDGRDPPITAPGVHDVNTRQTHTRRVATTARENERTATPAGETTVNGTGTVVIAATADAEISMTDHLDVTVIET
ncbi:hypothetical protein KXX06_008826, partial [Aspergillus fumigatus]